MSKEIDRKQVLQNIRVRKFVRNDSWWIKPKDNQGNNKEKRNPAAEKKGARVLSATRKFEVPSKRAIDEVNPAPKNAPTKTSKVDTVGDTKLQSPTEQLIENGKTQADKVSEENKKIEASALIDKPNVDNKKKADEFSADNKEETQPATAVKQNLDAAAPAEPAETTPAKETPAEDKKKHAAAPPDPSNIDKNEFKAPSDAKVENCVPQASARRATSASSGTAKVPPAPKVQLKAPEIVVTQAEPESPTNVETENKEVPIQTVNGGEKKSLPTETRDAVVQAVKIIVESVPETAVNSGADSDLQVKPLSDSPAQPAEKTPSGGEAPAASQDVQPVPDTLSKSPPADAPVKSAEQELDSASPPHAKQVSGTRTQEVKSAPEQSFEPKHQDTVDHVAALPIKEVVVPAPDPEAVQDNSAFRAINLTEALDVKPQSNKSAPKPEESQQTVPEKQKQQDDNTKSSVTRFQKPEEKLSSTQTQNHSRYGKSGCSFCNRIIDGNIRLLLNEPPVTLHPECLQCGVCAKVLGDLLTLVFLHDKVIHCNDCFQKAVKV